MATWIQKLLPPLKSETSPQNFLSTIVNPREAKIDIVAVHGLNPFGHPDHAESTWKANGTLWLSDERFLPCRLPYVRVMLFGYNSNVAFGTTTAGLIEQADNLLNRLAAKRAESPNRPLIFICHSLGGLIVKRALIASSNERLYTGIYEATYGVVFFGTPHRGGNGAALGAIATSIARAVLGNPPNSFMEALTSKSALLNTITADFRQFLERLYFISFFETRALSKTRKLVVDPDSATLGLSSERERQIGLDADHNHICKFANRDDPMYQQVEDNIATMVEKALAKKVQTTTPLEALPKNMSRINGSRNVLMQHGQANRSLTQGDVNKTHQFGNSNESEVDGHENTITQISSGGPTVIEASLRYLVNQWTGQRM